MNRKMALGFVVLALVIGVVVGATRTPKIEPGNSLSEVTTINLRLNERHELPWTSRAYIVYSGWTGTQVIRYQITVVTGLISYPIYVHKGATFLFGGRIFKVKQVTQERITLTSEGAEG